LESTLGEIAEIGEVDPGDALSGTLGLGFAFNERTSVSFGYSHDWVFETETEVNGEVQKSRDLQVGSFLFGISHRLDEMTTMNFNVEVGATEDAPDVRVALRVPIWLTLFR
jgi:outer membrane translocation and assembly module TamA